MQSLLWSEALCLFTLNFGVAALEPMSLVSGHCAKRQRLVGLPLRWTRSLKSELPNSCLENGHELYHLPISWTPSAQQATPGGTEGPGHAGMLAGHGTGFLSGLPLVSQPLSDGPGNG